MNTRISSRRAASGERISRRSALKRGGTTLAASALTATGLVSTTLATDAAPSVLVSSSQSITGESVTAAIARVETLAPELLAKTGVPGLAIGVVYQDQVAYLKGFGVQEAGTNDPIDADTIFQLASVSKPIASTVVAAVVGDGVVTWDTRISDIDPSFALAEAWVTREVALRDMFCHRSGLPEHAGDLLEDIGFDRETVLHRLRYQRPATSFRSAYAYTNFGLTAAAVAAARAANTEWERLSAKRLYQPLGMTRTSSRFVDYDSAENRAQLHVEENGAWVAKNVRDADAQSPAGGVSSTVRDLAQWMRLQLGNGAVDGKQIVAVEPLAETHRPQIINSVIPNPATDRAGFYGLGWGVRYDEQGKIQWSHSGAFALGAGTTVYLLPADGLGIVVLTNGFPIGLAESVALSFLDLARTGELPHDYLELLKPVFASVVAPNYGTTVDYATPPAGATAALGDDAYLGDYRNDFVGDIAIVTENGGLAIQLGPRKTAYPMQHYARDVFSYQPPGENAFGPSGITFAVGADGRATSVLIENLNIHGEGSFLRVPKEK